MAAQSSQTPTALRSPARRIAQTRASPVRVLGPTSSRIVALMQRSHAMISWVAVLPRCASVVLLEHSKVHPGSRSAYFNASFGDLLTGPWSMGVFVAPNEAKMSYLPGSRCAYFNASFGDLLT